MMNKRLAVATLLILFLIVIACYPPAGPDHDVVELRRDPADFAGRGVGSGGGCPVLDGVRGWQGGPWNSDHQFPRLYHFFAENVRGNYSAAALDGMALMDVVELMVDAPYWGEGSGLYNMPASDDNPFDYLRTANNGLKVMAYVPAFYWWNDTSSRFGSTFHPVKVAVESALDDANGGGGDWWLRNASGSRLPAFGEYLANLSVIEPDLDGSGRAYYQWFRDYMTGTAVYGKQYSGTDYWDGIRFDVADSTPHYLNTGWDADDDGTADRLEFGKPVMNDDMTAGLNTVADALETAGAVVIGNGAWAPGNTIDSPAPGMGHMSGAMDEDWPTYAWYDPYKDGPTSSSAGASWGGESATANIMWSLHMRQYANWMDQSNGIYVLLNADLSGKAAFASTITSTVQSQRFILASALLDNGYVTTRKGNGAIQWCDECGVTAGATAQTLAATGWLGCPLSVAQEASYGRSLRWYIDAGRWNELGSYVWYREFTNGLVVVNPTGSVRTINIGNGWDKIDGVYDTSHNDGSAAPAYLRVPARDAYVLVRAGAATPTATATPPGGVTATPTPTPTKTPTPQATATSGPSPTLGTPATNTPAGSSYDFAAENSTPPATGTPPATPETPVWDGNTTATPAGAWPWRVMYGSSGSPYTGSLSVSRITPTWAADGAYLYADCNAGDSTTRCASVYPVATPITDTNTTFYAGYIDASMVITPSTNGLSLSTLSHLSANKYDSGDDYWDPRDYSNTENVWQLGSCNTANSANALPCKTNSRSVYFWCRDCTSATPAYVTLQMTPDYLEHRYQVAWDIEASQASTLTLHVDGTPTPAFYWAGTANATGIDGWNAVVTGLNDQTYLRDGSEKLAVDYVYACDTMDCPTPTPAASGHGENIGWITEVLASQGVGDDCVDWNLRAGCGVDDEFVEIMSLEPRALAGWVLTVGSCEYTFADDNWTGPLKVIWADQMAEADGSPCLGFPDLGTVTLENPAGDLADSRAYYTYRPGESWQAAAWTYPAGAWQSGTPTP